jgi:uncharacterized protein (DUF2461 family)
MKGSQLDSLPLEPLLHAYIQAGVPAPESLGLRAQAVLSAKESFLSADFLDHVPDGVFQTAMVSFYEACVNPALHTDRIIRKARVIRHALTHLRHGQEPLLQKLDRCLKPDGPYFVVGLGPSFWSAIVEALRPEAHPAWTPAVEAGLQRLDGNRNDSTYAGLLELTARIRYLAPSLTALHVEHFLSLVSLMEGRRLFAGAQRLSADLFAEALREVRAEQSLRERLRERGQALADAQQAIEPALAARDGKRLGDVLAAADPVGFASSPLDWGKHGEELTLWIGRLWENSDHLDILERFWQSDPLPGAGLWLPAAVSHLKDPQSYPLWNDAIRAGLARIDDSANHGPAAERYALFCETVVWLRKRYYVHPLETAEVLAHLAADDATADQRQGRFGGFCPDTFRFLRELEENNNRAWLTTQRSRYHFVLRQPLVELCQALGERYIEPVLHRQHGFDLESEARDGLALTRLTKNAYGRAGPYNTTLWIVFCGRDHFGRREATQFFVRLDSDGLRYGLLLGAHAAPARRALRQRLLGQADGLHSLLQQRGGFDGTLDDFRAWLGGKELALVRHLPTDSPLLHSDDLAGDILLHFDRLLPLYVAAVKELPPPAPIEKRFDEAAFQAQTYLDAGWLARARGLLRLKGQLILQGVPGTGKTHVARCLARLMTGDEAEAVCLAQLHPAYSYEEFVEGIRVKSIEANGRHDVTYPVEDGLLCSFAERAALKPAQPHVLLLDEINRANLPRVFGELLYLLEYRDQEVMLPCSRRRFRLPPNLYLVGTMNSADRSTTILDQALRRRFSFLEMPPDASILQAWFAAHPPAGGSRFAAEVVSLFEKLNGRLRTELGPACQVGHSYFMLAELEESKLRAVWQHQIKPLLEDHMAAHPGRTLPLEIDDYRDGTPSRPRSRQCV